MNKPRVLISRHLMAVSFAGLVALLSSGTVEAALINVANPLNVLPGVGRTVVVSSTFSGSGADMIDNQATGTGVDGPFIFANDSLNKLSVSGFNGGFTTIRIFTANDQTRQPTSVTIKSSTSLVTTLVATDYSTSLGTFTFSGPPTTAIPFTGTYDTATRGYFDMVLATPAPTGTQSLYMELARPSSGIRIYELQALAAVPEPASGVTLVGGTLLLLRRKQRA